MIKDVRSQWGKGFFRYGRPHFLVQKNFRFFEIYDVSARISGSGVELVRTVYGQMVNFSRFCADVLYGRPLTYHLQYKQPKM